MLYKSFKKFVKKFIPLTISRFDKEDKVLQQTARETKTQMQKLTAQTNNVRKRVDFLCNKLVPAGVGYFVPDAQKFWVDQYLDQINRIPDSNGTKFYKKLGIKIGIVCDEFYYDSVKDAAHFVYLSPNTWREKCEAGIDIFLFVTTWDGLLNGDWRGLGSLDPVVDGDVRNSLFAILDYCKQHSIPTVFYSKEDPPNYEHFIKYAKKCDHLFTTARECIPYYQNDCEREKIHVLPFGINPALHNPIGFYRANKDHIVLFSGAWRIKYPDRCQTLSWIFDGVLNSSYRLHIIDRYCPAIKSAKFPEKYFPNVSPSVNHQVLQKIHKLFNWSININTVTKSHTMFANRAYELQANGVLLLSNYSVGVDEVLPNIQIVNDVSEVTEILDNMSQNEVYERQIAGIRSVMSENTCYDRITELLSVCGIKMQQPERKVLVIAPVINEQVKMCFGHQSYKSKELIEQSQVTGELFSRYDIITWFDANDYYSPFYLEDMVNGFKYTSCDYITKDAWIDNNSLHKGIEHNYVQVMKSKYRTVFWRECFSWEQLRELEGNVEMPNGYSIDRLNYRAQTKINAADITSVAGGDYAVTVVIPVRNDGGYLSGKAFPSLYRSTLFKHLEIILYDMDSTDERTLQIEHDLAIQYSNVRVVERKYEQLENCIEKISAPYIAFLRPGTEIIHNGLAQLYAEAVDKQLDLVGGNALKLFDEVSKIDYYSWIKETAGADTFSMGLPSHIEIASWPEQTTQSLLWRKGCLPGAEFNNYSPEIITAELLNTLLTRCKRIRFLDLVTHTLHPLLDCDKAHLDIPEDKERVTLTRQQLMFKNNMNVSCFRNGQILTFCNHDSRSDEVKYAWNLVEIGKAFKYSTNYSSYRRFSFDFSAMPNGFYKINCCEKKGDGEVLQDPVAIVKVTNDNNVAILEEYSNLHELV